MFKAMCLIGSLFLAGCSDHNTAVRVLTDQGYTDVQTTGYAMFTCGEHDTASTGFVATSPAGKRVTGAVCSGWFKGATIRFD